MYTEAEDWIDKRVGEARGAQQPTVTNAVALRMTTLLKGKLGDAPLTANEVADTARALIGDMVTPVVSEEQSDDEN